MHVEVQVRGGTELLEDFLNLGASPQMSCSATAASSECIRTKVFGESRHNRRIIPSTATTNSKGDRGFPGEYLP